MTEEDQEEEVENNNDSADKSARRNKDENRLQKEGTKPKGKECARTKFTVLSNEN